MDISAVLRRIAERRIDDAIKEGKFDNLSGAGRPLKLEPLPADEDARMKWWAIRILRQNQIVPDEVRLRKRIELMRGYLDGLRDESRLAALVTQLNLLIRRLNTLGTNALAGNIAPVDLDVERHRLRRRCAE